MWRSRLSRTIDWLWSRRLIGEDENHRFYAEFLEKGKPEKRYVEYKDQNITHSTDRMPIEWWSWLHNRRDTAPTPEELVASEQRQRHLAQKVAILEAEDEKQRLRQFSSPKSETMEEKKTRRQTEVRKQLTQAAAMPSTARPSGGLDIVPSVIPSRSMDQGNDKRNEEEEPQVRELIFYSIFAKQFECTLLTYPLNTMFLNRELERNSNQDLGTQDKVKEGADNFNNIKLDNLLICLLLHNTRRLYRFLHNGLFPSNISNGWRNCEQKSNNCLPFLIEEQLASNCSQDIASCPW